MTLLDPAADCGRRSTRLFTLFFADACRTRN